MTITFLYPAGHVPPEGDSPEDTPEDTPDSRGKATLTFTEYKVCLPNLNNCQCIYDFSRELFGRVLKLFLNFFQA